MCAAAQASSSHSACANTASMTPWSTSAVANGTCDRHTNPMTTATSRARPATASRRTWAHAGASVGSTRVTAAMSSSSVGVACACVAACVSSACATRGPRWSSILRQRDGGAAVPGLTKHGFFELAAIFPTTTGSATSSVDAACACPRK